MGVSFSFPLKKNGRKLSLQMEKWYDIVEVSINRFLDVVINVTEMLVDKY